MPASKKTSAGKPANARPKAPTARAKGPAATPAPVPPAAPAPLRLLSFAARFWKRSAMFLSPASRTFTSSGVAPFWGPKT